MNLLVCVKQVPDTTEIKIDPVKNTLIRDGVAAIVNPFDAFALEAAARIKDKNPESKIVVLSMGPENAKKALRECLSIAADKAYLVSSRAFGGSDTLATSYIISNSAKNWKNWKANLTPSSAVSRPLTGIPLRSARSWRSIWDIPRSPALWNVKRQTAIWKS